MLNGWSPKHKVLSYATNVSISGLLSASNSSRTANGIGTLADNSQLDSAAQAKADDMVARNYWSHDTPDGKAPWVFINNAGYQYSSAAENLAYGFSDSDSTITGWMNSPDHRENLLNSSYSDVGFGFANSENFNGSGPETVVVAMYGKPQVLAATSATPAASATKAASTSASRTPTPEPAPVPVASTTDAAAKKTDQPTISKPTTVTISKAVALTNTSKPKTDFIIGAIIGLCVVAMILKQSLYLRRYLVKGERFILHHPLFDSATIGILLLALTLNQAVGYIK